MAAPNLLDDAAVRLMERLCRHLGAAGQGFGHFEQDERNFPMPLVRRHVQEQSLDFASLSAEMVTHLQQRVDEDKVEDGGYVLIARATVFGADCLYVALLQETLGTVIGDGWPSTTARTWILPACRWPDASTSVPGRPAPSATSPSSRGAATWPAGSSVFSGCTDVVIALKGKRLVRTITHFAETQQLTARRDELMERAHLILEQMNGERRRARPG